MVSLNLGYDVSWPFDKATDRRHTSISPNSYEDICATLDACYVRGIMPEPAVQDTGHLNNAFTLMSEGTIHRTNYFLVEPSGSWGDGHQGLPSTPTTTSSSPTGSGSSTPRPPGSLTVAACRPSR